MAGGAAAKGAPRILFLNNQGLGAIGGGPTILRHLVTGLGEAYAVTVASHDAASGAFPAVRQVQLPAGAAPRRLWRVAPLLRALAWRRAVPRALVREADLVVAVDVHAGLALARARRLLFLSLSCTPLQEAAMGLPPFLTWQYARLERVLARRAQRTLVSSHAHAADLCRTSRLPGLDPVALHPALPGPVLPMPGAPVTVLAAGRLVRGKDFAAFIRLAGLLRDLPCRWVLAGDGPERGALEAQAAASGAPVLFTGAVGEIGPLLAGAHVLVHPSPYESFGMVVFEAVRAGRPVLCDPRAGVNEVLPSAFLADFNDLGAVAARLRRLVSQPGHRAEMVALARAAAAKAMELPYLESVRDLIGAMLAA